VHVFSEEGLKEYPENFGAFFVNYIHKIQMFNYKLRNEMHATSKLEFQCSEVAFL